MVVIVVDFAVTAVAAAVFVVLVVVMLTAKFVAVNYKKVRGSFEVSVCVSLIVFPSVYPGIST